eukprot:GEMP01028651.1.p1 GENE.GEMP01028651.1~~GEMP01028651.1.p1  ORF type:complete len:513 (+),score=80.12 GEMP01028651.1:460-1998(+)
MQLVDGLEVRDIPLGKNVVGGTGPHIKGAVATRVFWKGEVAFDELPIAASQHFYSRKLVTSCEGCTKTLGSLRTRIGKILQSNIKGPEFLETDFPKIATDPLLDHPHFSREGMGYSSMVPCTCRSDCRSVFCSDTCLQERGETHRMISRGDWKKLFSYAAKKHENINVALKLLICPRRQDAVSMWNPRWSELSNIPPEWVALRKQIVDESLSLLRKYWCYDDIPLPTLEEWDRTLGIVDFTSKCLNSMNPANLQLMRAKRLDGLRDFFNNNGDFWAHVTHVGREAEAFHANSEDHTHPQQEVESFDPDDAKVAWAESGNIFNDFEGLGIYQTIAFLNHSCYPNLEVRNIAGSDRVQGRALRRIDIGEAVCMSYMDAEEPLAKRQKTLFVDYLFHCRCIKCRVQGAAHILEKGTVVTSVADEPLMPLIAYLTEYAEENQVPLRTACEDIIRCSPVAWTLLEVDGEGSTNTESDDESVESTPADTSNTSRAPSASEFPKCPDPRSRIHAMAPFV